MVIKKLRFSSSTAPAAGDSDHQGAKLFRSNEHLHDDFILHYISFSITLQRLKFWRLGDSHVARALI